jgi:hypothetical protein
MTMSIMPFVIGWVVLGVVVAALALMRRSVSAKEDDTIHLSGSAAVVANEQMSVAKKLDAIDKWGKILTIVLVVYGIILAVLYFVQVWEESAHVGLK